MSIKVESAVKSLALQQISYALQHAVHVQVGPKAVETRVIDLPRDVVEALCDQFKKDMLEVYDNTHRTQSIKR